MINKKGLKVLSIAAILSGIMEVNMPIDAQAAIDAYIIKVSKDIYSYNKYELNEDFLNFKAGETSKLYNDFVIKLKMGNGFYAFQDKKRGFIEYEKIESDFLRNKTEHKKFDLDIYTESKECKIIEVKWTKKAVMTKAGEVTYLIPKDNGTNNKISHNDDNKQKNENLNISNVETESKDNTEKPHKHKHKRGTRNISNNNDNKEEQILPNKNNKNDVEEKKAKKDKEVSKEKINEKKEAKAKEDIKPEKEDPKQGKQINPNKEIQTKDKNNKPENNIKKQNSINLELQKQQEKERQREEDLKTVKAVKDTLQFDNLDNLITDLNLPEQGKNNVLIVWKSSNISVINEKGKIIRPEVNDGDAIVTLTAILSKGEVKATKEFQVVVKAKEQDELDALNLVKDSLQLPSNIEKDINLPSILDGAMISWKSNKEFIISNTGKVKRPALGNPDEIVTLTANIIKGKQTVTKDFQVTIKAHKELIASNKQEFYNILKEALENFETDVKIKVLNYNSDDYNLNIISNIVKEHPNIDYGYNGSDGKVSGFEKSAEKTLIVNLKYRLSKEKMIEEKEAVKKKVQDILKSEIKEGMSDVQKELVLHDYVVKKGKYDVEHVNDKPVLPEDHNAYGILVQGVGVCESYAKAMYELLNSVGIECKFVTGTSKKTGVGHAWNMVKLDNEWYNLDATWDDPISDRNGSDSMKKEEDKQEDELPVLHTYFNVSDKVFNKDHERGNFEKVNYPKCTATTYSYDNLNIPEYTSDHQLIEKVSSIEKLDEKILETFQSKNTKLVLKIKNLNMNFDALTNEVEKVRDNNNLNIGYRLSCKLSGDYIIYKFQF
ncbi:immunoglobulin-like domain-containing protein [Clostridium novyi]|uniref:immunoglobulin-like domain-containing protein n=1 Tax=Clostridium novyi TaxID=1542 RepID=UPI00057FFD99|nr:immunoglobulin-like domain-containing protein [Clostridium novyi]